MDKGIIFIISGPAGSGKGTVVNLLREKMPELGVSVSATTRKPRPGESEGVNYYYISREDFLSRIENDEILEYTEYCGNMYGTLKSEACRILDEGRDIILEIEVEGALQVKKLMPRDTVMIMLLAPTPRELEGRLRGRGTESDDVIEKRLRRAKEEILKASNYDYIVTNETGKSSECADKIKNIIQSEHTKYSRMENFIAKYNADLDEIVQ